MKNLLLASIVGLLASTSMAGVASDTLEISGTVASINEIVINPNVANKDSLNITGGEVSKNVASVDETSNNLNGYRIMMSSLNGSKLVHTINALYSTDYKVSYNGGAMTTLTTTPAEIKNSGPLTGLQTVTSLVDVSVTAFAAAPAGTYTDTITISIEAL